MSIIEYTGPSNPQEIRKYLMRRTKEEIVSEYLRQWREFGDLEKERDALAAHVARLHDGVKEYVTRDSGFDIIDLIEIVNDSPETSLTRLCGEVRRQVAEEWEVGLPRIIAEKQAEAIWQFITEIEEAGWETAPALVVTALHTRCAELRRQAEGEHHD